MKPRFSPIVFAVAFCLVYAFVFARDLPMFRYYPLHGQLIWGAGTLKQAGPAMNWYGFVSDAAIAAAILAVLVPNRVADRLRGFIWLFPVALMLWVLFLLKPYFLFYLKG